MLKCKNINISLKTKKLISNFIFLICKIKRNWSSKDQKNQLIKDVRKQGFLISIGIDLFFKPF